MFFFRKKIHFILLIAYYCALSLYLCVFQRLICSKETLRMYPFLKSVGRVGVRLPWIHSEKGREFVRPDKVPWERPFPSICLQIHCIKQERLRAGPALTLPEEKGELVGSQRLCLGAYYSSFFKDGRLDTSWSKAGTLTLDLGDYSSPCWPPPARVDINKTTSLHVPPNSASVTKMSSVSALPVIFLLLFVHTAQPGPHKGAWRARRSSVWWG